MSAPKILTLTSELSQPTCEYMMRRDGEAHLRECGDPAHWRGAKPPRLCYCDAHAHFVSHVGKHSIHVERLNA